MSQLSLTLLLITSLFAKADHFLATHSATTSDTSHLIAGVNEKETLTSIAGDLLVTVLDVGPGLCTVVRLPDGRFILYDLGDQPGGSEKVYNQIATLVPPGAAIELLVLSHTDSDHIGAAQQVLENYRVKKVLHTGFEKKMVVGGKRTGTLQRFYAALRKVPYPIEDINLNKLDSIITPGTSFTYGAVKLVFLCGFGRPLPEWRLPASDYSKRVNGVSIMMKLEYAGRSVLFGGDAVGRFDGQPATDLQATERYLIDNAAPWLDSDIVIAPHHGADNGSSTAFIKATSPEYVIFSAGHKHQHPRQVTAARYLAAGVPAKRIFRTDRGDDESRANKPDDEWIEGRTPGCKDATGDDDVEIIIGRDGSRVVRYKKADAGCGQVVVH
jgi:beta-lactamase superfamily II metal-dependent hydrolase